MSSADYRVVLLLSAKDELTRGVMQAKKAVKDFADSAEGEARRIGGIWRSVAGGLNDVLKITLGVGLAGLLFQALDAVRGFVAGSIKAYAELERESVKLAALTREAGQDTRMLAQVFSTVASAASRQYAVSARDAMSALESLVKAGLSARDSIQALGAVIMLAKTENVDYATTSNAVVQVLAQFGLSGAEALRVVDALANAARKGIGSAVDFARGLANAGASARALGLSLEDATTWLVILEKGMGNAAEAGTLLNRFLLELYEIAGKLGVPVRDASGALRSTNDIILDVIAAAKSLGGDFEMLQTRLAGVDMRAARALIMLAQMTRNVAELREEIGRAGTVSEAFAATMDTTIGKFEQMTVRVEASQRRIGETMSNLAVLIGGTVLPAIQVAFDAWTGIVAYAVGDVKTNLESAIDAQLTLGRITQEEAADWIMAWVEMGRITRKEALDIAGRLLDLETIAKTSLMGIVEEFVATGQEVPEAFRPLTQSLTQVQEKARETGDTFVKVAQKFKVSADEALRLAKAMFGLDLVYDEHADLVKMLQAEYGLTEEQARRYIQALEAEAEKARQAREEEKGHGDALKQVRETLQSSVSSLINYGRVFGPMAENIRNARKALMELAEQGEKTPAQLSNFLDFMDSLNKKFASLERQAKALSAAQQVAGLGASYYSTITSIQNALIADQVAALEEQIAELKRQEDELRLHGEIQKKELEQTRRLREELENKLQALRQGTKLTAEQAASQERLAAINQTLGLTSQIVTLQQTALQLAMLGADSAADMFMGTAVNLTTALEDGIVTQDEMKTILEGLGVQFDDTGRPVINLKSIMEEFRQKMEETRGRVEDFRSSLISLDGLTAHTYHYHHEVTVREGEGARARRQEEEWWMRMGYMAPPTAQRGAWETREGLYYLHRGEMVLPRGVAEWVRQGGISSQKVVNVSVNINASGVGGPRELAELVSRELVRRLRAM